MKHQNDNDNELLVIRNNDKNFLNFLRSKLINKTTYPG